MAPSDEERSSSDESVDDGIPLGTKREFTVCEEDRIFLMRNFKSTHLATRKLPYLIVRTKSGVIAAALIYQIHYFDELGVSWKGETYEATDRLWAARHYTVQTGDAYECTNAGGSGTVTVYSEEPLDGQYWVRELLGTREQSDFVCSKVNASIPRCVRQLKVNTLEELAPYFDTDPLSFLAYFARSKLHKKNLKGNVGHLFTRLLGNPKESVYVAPRSRSELEGITLVRIDNTDYSLVSGRHVGYEPMGDVFHAYAEGGSLSTIDDDALVG